MKKKKDVFHLEITQRQQQLQPQTTTISYPLSDSSARHLISPQFRDPKSLRVPKISPFPGITPREVSPHCTESIFPRKTNFTTNNDVKFQNPLFPLNKRFSDNFSVVSSPQLSFRNQTSSMFHPQNSCRINSPEKQLQDAPQRPPHGLMKKLIFPPSKNEKGLFSLPSDISANRNYSIRFSEAMTANKVKKKIIASILQQDKGSVFETNTTGSSSLASISPRKQQQTFLNSLGSTFFGDISNNLRKTAINSVHEQGQDQQGKWRKTGFQSLHRNTSDEEEKRNIFSHLLAQQKYQSKEGGGIQGVAKLSQAYQLINVNALDEYAQQRKQSQFDNERTTQPMNNASVPEKKGQLNQKMHQEVDIRNDKGKREANGNSKYNTQTKNTNSPWVSFKISNRNRNNNNASANSNNAVRVSNQTSSVKASKSTSLYFSAPGSKKTQNVIQQTTFIETLEEAFAKEFKWVEWDQKEEAHDGANYSQNIIINQQTTTADSQQTDGSSLHKSRVRMISQNQRDKGSREESQEGGKLNHSKGNIGKETVKNNEKTVGLDDQTKGGSEVNEEEREEVGITAAVAAQEILHLDNSENDAAASSSLMTPVLSESNIEGSYSNGGDIQQRTFWYEEPSIFDLTISVFTTKEQFLQKLNKKVNIIFQDYLLSQQQEQQGSLKTLNSPRLTKKISFIVESLDVLQIIKQNNNNSLFELLKTYLRSGLLQTTQGISQEMQFSPRLTGFTTFHSQVKLRSPRVQNTSIKCNIIVLSKPRRNFKDAIYSTPQKATKQQVIYAPLLGQSTEKLLSFQQIN